MQILPENGDTFANKQSLKITDPVSGPTRVSKQWNYSKAKEGTSRQLRNFQEQEDITWGSWREKGKTGVSQAPGGVRIPGAGATEETPLPGREGEKYPERNTLLLAIGQTRAQEMQPSDTQPCVGGKTQLPQAVTGPSIRVETSTVKIQDELTAKRTLRKHPWTIYSTSHAADFVRCEAG